MTYTTLAQVREYLQSIGTEMSTDADTLLWRFIRQATQNIDVYCRRRFDARIEERLFDYQSAGSFIGAYSATSFVNSIRNSSLGILRMDDDLLSVTTITNGDGTTVSSDEYVLEAANRYPKYAIRLLGSSGIVWQPSDNGDKEQCISVLGVWGYNSRYTDAWLDSLDTVQDDPLLADSVSITVDDADGIDGNGDTPRFQIGQMLRIEDEYINVLAVNTTTNVLTVSRGINGSTAVAHDSATKMYIYQVETAINVAATRLSSWMFHQRDAPFSRTGNTTTGEYEVPIAMPDDVVMILSQFRREENLA